MDAPLKGGRWRALRRCGVGEDIGAGVGTGVVDVDGVPRGIRTNTISQFDVNPIHSIL